MAEPGNLSKDAHLKRGRGQMPMSATTQHQCQKCIISTFRVACLYATLHWTDFQFSKEWRCEQKALLSLHSKEASISCNLHVHLGLSLWSSPWSRHQIHLIFDVNIVFIFRAPSVLLPSQKARHHSHMCLIRTTVLEICHFITTGLQLHSMKWEHCQYLSSPNPTNTNYVETSVRDSKLSTAGGPRSRLCFLWNLLDVVWWHFVSIQHSANSTGHIPSKLYF